MNTSLESRISILRDRGAMLSCVRAFFQARDVLEVDCPALSRAAPIDTHIDVMHVSVQEAETGYLHTSPEYGMKRLLAEGIGDIYQMSHVFRQGECGALHNPEFTMIEWYRTGFTFDALIQETVDLVLLFLPELPTSTLSYREALELHTGIDYVCASRSELVEAARFLAPHLPLEANEWDRDTLLNSLMSFVVEPHLGQAELTIIKHFPASQSALAKTVWLGDSEEVAARFEIYYRGIELANGYHELTCPVEQRRRLEAASASRAALGKSYLPLDENLIRALEAGLPDCCGVAVGFDRLMLLRHGKDTLSDILPFSWTGS